MITTETVQKRKELLSKQRQELIDLAKVYDQKKIETVDQLNAVDGAIQDCDYWLKELASGTSEQTEEEKGV